MQLARVREHEMGQIGVASGEVLQEKDPCDAQRLVSQMIFSEEGEKTRETRHLGPLLLIEMGPLRPRLETDVC